MFFTRVHKYLCHSTEDDSSEEEGWCVSFGGWDGFRCLRMYSRERGGSLHPGFGAVHQITQSRAAVVDGVYF